MPPVVLEGNVARIGGELRVKKLADLWCAAVEREHPVIPLCGSGIVEALHFFNSLDPLRRLRTFDFRSERGQK